MKKALLICFAAAVGFSANAERDIRFFMNSGETKCIAVSRVDSIIFDEANDLMQIAHSGKFDNIELTLLDSIQYGTLPTGVFVTYAAEKATVLNPFAFDGVSIDIEGADVCVTSALTEEAEYHLAGSSNSGSFKLYGSKKYELHLNGLTLANDNGAAINIQCGKRGQIFLTDGTVNQLSDAASYDVITEEDQKGTLFSEGQLIFMGNGALTVTGLYKHAICSDDYIAVRSGTIKVENAAGDALHANDSIMVHGGYLSLSAADDVIDCEGIIAINAGSVEIQASADSSKGIKSDSEVLLAGGETTISMSGNAALDADSELSYCTAIKTGAHYRQTGGNLTINANGIGGQGVSADSTLTVIGGKLDITIAGTGSSYTSSSGTTDYYSVKALKSDGPMNLLSGEIDCKASGNGGKCIVADGLLTIGSADAGPTLTAITEGSALSSSSNSNQGNNNRPGGGGGNRPGGGNMGGDSGFNAAPKAIKGATDVIINNGTIYVKTQADGGEGIESKANMTINGGNIECATYDDGINAAASLTINAGAVYCHATNNDAIDSNGSIAIHGGIILASGSSAPEEGFDCDQNTFIIDGGTLIGTGGATSSPTSASQRYATLSSVTVSNGKYLSITDSSGNVICSYRCPNTINSATVLLSSPMFDNSTHSLLYNVTSLSSPENTLFDGVFSTGGTTSGGSSKSFTPSTR